MMFARVEKPVKLFKRRLVDYQDEEIMSLFRLVIYCLPHDLLKLFDLEINSELNK